ncbi:MAG: hypothetical protein JWM74_3346, partial [Myxococcaceae bacterium]|nr:hypothetical protein [Myxococcaceae bacterium]
MNATARDIVELSSTEYELSDVSDRNTDVPNPPPMPALDLGTTQQVPKLVLSELRYQARLRSNPRVTALAANDDAEAIGVASDTTHLAPTADVTESDAATVDVVHTSIETTIEAKPSRGGMRGAIAAGVALGLAATALVAGVL